MSVNARLSSANGPGSKKLIRVTLVATTLLCGLFASSSEGASARVPAAARRGKTAEDTAKAAELMQNYCNDLEHMTLKQGPRSNDGAARNLLLSLRNVSQSDIAAKGSFSYDFFRREFDQEELKRKEIMEFLDKTLEFMR